MNQGQGFDKLLMVITKLLSPEGCPWDREQNPDTLCDYLVEEVFELVNAIRSKNVQEIKEEMGDVFFLLFFMAHFYDKDFSLEDVWQTSAAKMISRHPHVFEDKRFESREDLLHNWEKVKKQEKQGENKSLFSSIPKNLPPLLMAYRVSSKAARAGFTWSKDEEVEKKLAEEWQEFMQARSRGDNVEIEKEFGDYLFTLVEFGRRNKVKANTALSKANSKFLNRVSKMEFLAIKRGVDISELDMQQLDCLWDEAKTMD